MQERETESLTRREEGGRRRVWHSVELNVWRSNMCDRSGRSAGYRPHKAQEELKESEILRSEILRSRKSRKSRKRREGEKRGKIRESDMSEILLKMQRRIAKYERIPC